MLRRFGTMTHKIPGFTCTYKMRKIFFNLAFIGILVYLSGFYFLDSGKCRLLFYIFVFLPALGLFAYSNQLFKKNLLPVCSFLIFMAYFILSASWGEGRWYHVFKDALLIFCLILAIWSNTQRFSQDFITKFHVTIGGIFVCYYFYSIFVANILVSNRFVFKDLIRYGSDNPIDCANVLGVVMLSAWWLLPNKKIWVQISLIAVMVMSFVLMLMTQSRGPIIALGITLASVVLLRRHKSYLVMLVLFGTFIMMALFFDNFTEIAARRIEQNNYRLAIWSQMFEVFKENWLLGQGFGIHLNTNTENMVFAHSHNSVLEIFRVGGITGGVIFFALLFYWLCNPISQKKYTFFLAWFLYGILCLSTNGRMLITRPGRVEVLSFWVPLFLAYFHTAQDGQRQTICTCRACDLPSQDRTS